MYRLFALLLPVLLLLFLCVSASAAPAEDLTPLCTFTSNSPTYLARLTDGKIDRHFQTVSYQENYLEVTAPDSKPIDSMYIIWTKDSGKVLLEVFDEKDGRYRTYRTVNAVYLHEYIPLPENTHRIRFSSTDKLGTLAIREISLYGPGDLPSSVQMWQPSCREADLLVLVAHPDDEYLFFGGTIPWYAREVGCHVAVAYMTLQNDTRAHELLNGLWTAGVREYPYLLGFDDKLSFSLSSQYRFWGKEETLQAVIKLFETAQPKVVVTQGVEGEYGHGGHQVVADLCLRIIRDGEGDSTFRPHKLYVHMLDEHPVHMNWNVPITSDKSVHGKTSLEVAQDAFLCHQSQQGFSQEIQYGPYRGQRYKFEVVEGGLMDNAFFGLAYSDVGPDDSGVSDFLQHIDTLTSGDVAAFSPVEASESTALPTEEPAPTPKSRITLTIHK
ncbi:MAG: PIG-L family deacetylase [Clostridia bacterium]|nr:PIG-L family deacetylase [Clostridia bacterium]